MLLALVDRIEALFLNPRAVHAPHRLKAFFATRVRSPTLRLPRRPASTTSLRIVYKQAEGLLHNHKPGGRTVSSALELAQAPVLAEISGLSVESTGLVVTVKLVLF
jgi:hypothetical protein